MQGHIVSINLKVVRCLEHRGSFYALLDHGTGDCLYIAERPGQQPGMVDWRVRLAGQHVGWDLDVWLTNVRLAPDEDGPGHYGTWDGVVWADDGTPLDDAAFLDGYTDILAPEVARWLRES